MAVKETTSKKTQEKEGAKARAKAEARQAAAPEKQIKVKLVRSLIGRPKKQREVVKGLGLRRINSEVTRKDCPEIWGMINKVPHLVEVKELDKK
ncbi:MAG: 50S ribosomal protein L30 [Candidatus Aminicenantes bacterium]|nr:50S ribosomal protein L30 [Candidatus Aminicenantes bacterium]